MLSNELYVKQSLEINLFFLRILKEHALFMHVSFPAKNDELIKEAQDFNYIFNNLLAKAIQMTDGVMYVDNDAVTPYTLEAEKATSFVTGVPIDTNLTSSEYKLFNQNRYMTSNSLIENVSTLNNEALQAAQSIAQYKTKVINGVLSCQLYTTNYPLLLDHIRREALFFIDLLTKLQYRVEANAIEETLRQQIFWNQIMSEHAKFIKGYLDPSEEALILVASNFGNQFSELKNKALQTLQNPHLLPQLTTETIKSTKEIKEYKTQSTQGLIECKIKSIILPLLSDHVLREATHYLNLLNKIKV